MSESPVASSVTVDSHADTASFVLCCDSMQELIHKLRAYEQEHNDLVLEITAHMLLAVRASAQDRLQVPILCQECAEICLAVSSLAAAEALCMLCQCLHAVIKTHSRI